MNSRMSVFFHHAGCQRVALRTSLDNNWCGSIARGQDFNRSSRLAVVEGMYLNLQI
jgi:hypothetical protein